jgi:hypothetical protein
MFASGRRLCGLADACVKLARSMYIDKPHAHEVGHVGAAVGGASSAGLMEGHDVPQDVMTSIVYWTRKGGLNPTDHLDACRRASLEGGMYCCNDGCEVVGHYGDFKRCPQCKSARYCGDACQKQDWTTGGHKATCGTYTHKVAGANKTRKAPVSAPTQA